MPNFRLHIRCNKSTFTNGDGDTTPDSARPELVRLLREVAQRIEDGDMYDYYRTILDTSGNDVGTFAIKES